ncbi:MAG: glycosyltransferase [Actinobacteria bacterium]|nr:glycosyltransferase [Actinomycetota bacterium]MTA01504.1 glycosyltransferase [Actinomycetota bacterium]
MAAKIRVMRIIARMNVGGPAVQVSGLMRGFDQNIFDQRLFTGYCAGDEADYLELIAPDIPVTRIEGLGRSIKAKDDLLVLFRLMGEIRRFKPNYIHTHTAKAGLLGRLAAILSFSNAKLIHTYHGHLLHGYFSPAKTKVLIYIERMLAKRSFKIVSVGAQVRDDLLAAHIGKPAQYVVIPPGISLGTLPNSLVARESLGVPQDATTITFLGRITGIKRPDRFAEVALKIASDNPKVVFLIVGSGDLVDSLKVQLSKIDSQVKFLGWRSDVENISSATDILLLTSDNEGTPVSAIQAGMAGVPTISTNVGSVAEVIKNGSAGVLTSLDVSEIVNAVQSLLSDPALRNRLGESAKTDMSARYGVARLVTDYQNLYLA